MAQDFIFVGNELWLDFVNTVVLEKGETVDLIGEKSTWNEWLKAAQLPAARGEKPFAEAVKFRKILKELADDLGNGKKAKPALVEKVNEYLKLDFSHPELVKVEGGWTIRDAFLNEDPLSTIARSVAQSLAFANKGLIRKCEAHDCVLHFVDTSKSHKRRWCSMKTCGNRAKVSAFLARER